MRKSKLFKHIRQNEINIKYLEDRLGGKVYKDCNHEWLKLEGGGVICTLCAYKNYNVVKSFDSTQEKIEDLIKHCKNAGGEKQNLLKAVGTLWDQVSDD